MSTIRTTEIRSFRELIALWPTRVELGRRLGARGGTVQTWHDRNSVPAWAFEGIVREARSLGHESVTADLLVRLAAHNGTLPDPPADLPDHRDASSAQSEGEAA